MRAQKWVARYDGGQNRDDFSSVVVVDATGDFYVSGYATDGQGHADVRVIKYRGDSGTRLWEWQSNTPSDYLYDSVIGMPRISRLAIGLDGNPVLMAQTETGYTGGYEHVRCRSEFRSAHLER